MVEACCNEHAGSSDILEDGQAYLDLLYRIMISCEVQPTQARLNVPLQFAWKSGLENLSKSTAVYKSDSMAYDLALTLMTLATAHCQSATYQHSVTGDFVSAAREYRTAASICFFVSDKVLPMWMTHEENASNSTLPLECHIPTVLGVCSLYQAQRQQMAVAHLLMKQSGDLKYSMLAQLSLGVYELLTEYRTAIQPVRSRLDSSNASDLLLEIELHIWNSLSAYFWSMHLWHDAIDSHGKALCVLKYAAMIELQERPNKVSLKGIPHLTAGVADLRKDLTALRKHYAETYKSWCHDNDNIFRESVPEEVDVSTLLLHGSERLSTFSELIESYSLKPVIPVVLQMPDSPPKTQEELQQELIHQYSPSETVR